MQHLEPEPTRHVEHHSFFGADETIDGSTSVGSTIDRSMELERIRQLEEEVKMLREEVNLTPSWKDDPL